MAFSSTTQVGKLRGLETYYTELFKGTAGASGNTVDIGFVADNIVGLPTGATWTQSGKTVTISGLTNGHVYNLIFLGKRPL